MRESRLREGAPTRRVVLATIGGGCVTVLAGCSGGDGTGGGNASNDGGTSGSTGSGGGDGGSGGGSGGGSTSLPDGLESATLSGKTLTVRRVEDSNVDGVRIYDPNNEQVIMGDFNTVQREIELDMSSGTAAAKRAAGDWTIETYAEGGSTIDTGPITFTRSFAVTEARYQSPGGDLKGDEKLLFKIESTGDLPVRIQSIAVLETTNPERLAIPTPTAEGTDIKGPSARDFTKVWTGQPKEMYVEPVQGEFTFTTEDDIPENPCAGTRLERTYELTDKTGESVTVDVALEFGEGAHKDAGYRYWCTNGEVVEFSGGSSG